MISEAICSGSVQKMLTKCILLLLNRVTLLKRGRATFQPADQQCALSNLDLTTKQLLSMEVCTVLTNDVWMSQQVSLHFEGADLIATTLDDVDAAAAQDPVDAIFVDCCVS